MEYSNVTAKIFRLILVKLIAKDPKEITKISKIFLLFLKDFFLFIAVAIQFNIDRHTYIYIYST